MRVFVLNTGSELLLGDVRDAHLSFIAQQILELGMFVSEQRTVGDGPAIGSTLAEIFPQADLIFVTGGLGPTSDDITRDLTAQLLNLDLVRDQSVLDSINERLTLRKITPTESIQRQANVPRGAEVLPNHFGTAPGLFLRARINPAIASPDLFLLPGPPRELQPIFLESVMPRLRKIVSPSGVVRRLYKIANMGESVVETSVGAKLLALPGLEVGYCARPGEVDLRLVGRPEVVHQGEKIVLESLGRLIFTCGTASLEETVVRSLVEAKASLAIAESCTGGLLSNRITDVPGASEVLLAGYVTYSNDAKVDVLDVERALIARAGAVSAEVAAAMAEGARKRTGAVYSLSTTGIAGPAGGSPEKPVGTVFIGLSAGNSQTMTQKCFFPTDRTTFKQMVAQAAFEMLRRAIGASGGDQ
jgi:competence/damage-inducible protein CinA-like protein